MISIISQSKWSFNAYEAAMIAEGQKKSNAIWFRYKLV